MKRLVELLLVIVLLSGCSEKGEEDQGSVSRVVSEQSQCTLVLESGTLVTGTASFKVRMATSNGLMGGSSALPIRYAEVRLLDENRNIVSCGNTDASGTFTLYSPATAGSYIAQVNSRAYNSKLQASVLNNTTENAFYSLEQSFTVTDGQSTATVSPMLANYKCPSTDSDCPLEAGAFNILDQIFRANEYLRNNSSCSFCSDFTVAPKMNAYWARGFNPYSYSGYPDVLLSYFTPSDVPEERNLYILGGKNGDTDYADTDHFDNSVILHEYAHFLQNAYNANDYNGNPSHNGNSIIDARLAWSEGWANFFQAAVSGTSVYRDTVGNEDGATSIGIEVNIENQTRDIPTYTGEGTFREISVSRILYDFIDLQKSGTTSDGTLRDTSAASVPFAYIWNTFIESDSNGYIWGMKSSSAQFRDIGLFNQLLRARVASYNSTLLTEFDNSLLVEKQKADRSEYGQRLKPKVETCSYSIVGVPDILNASGQYVSHQQRSNDFYHYYHDGTSSFDLTLKYNQSGSKQTDLDLYVYNFEYAFDEPEYMVGSSHALNPEVVGSTTGRERVTLANLPAGHYMINVRVNTSPWTSAASASGNGATYWLEFGSAGERLCP